MAAPGPAERILAELARHASARPAVILDDDPTGTQTLRDVPVLTAWTADAIARHLDEPVVFLSTNSRSLDEQAAVALVTDAVEAALAAARARDRPISLVSRSDSTLRGHFPAETAAIARAAGAPDARVLLAPFFAEGGRVTVGDVHYLEGDAQRVPVAETEFARDPVFGYRASALRDWVAEKHAAVGLPVPPLASLGLQLIRQGGPQAVAEELRALSPRAVAIVNSEKNEDIEIVALGALLAEQAGLPLVARVAASYVRARAGRRPAPLLPAAALPGNPAGLIVVGSHVETTTRQLEQLVEQRRERVMVRELAVDALIGQDEAEIAGATAAVEEALRQGGTALVASERTPRDVGLSGARAISIALAEIVSRVRLRPAWVLAKGGITSSDVARHGLRMTEARVAGQLLPGVPVWIAQAGGRWPGLPLVVFPGNVGAPTALADAVTRLGRDGRDGRDGREG
ncbi:MAG: hypothetical protein M3N29_07970 [Chloroflexota bacterium]|nr:hypothetical protein [Chloroflexota bacterium]